MLRTSLLRELLSIVVMALLLAIALPRVLLGRTPRRAYVSTSIRETRVEPVTEVRPVSSENRGETQVVLPPRALPVRRVQRAGGTSRTQGSASRLTQLEDGTYRVDLRGVSDPSALVPGLDARLIPSQGFQLQRLDRFGYLQSAGLLPGDRLIGLDDRSTRSLDELLSAWIAIRNAQDVRLRFARGDRSFELRARVERDAPR